MSNGIRNSILIVDDEKQCLIDLVNILEPDYIVYAAKNGATALEKAHEVLPDLIILDIVMQKMSGFDVIKELKNSERTKNIPIIFITAMGEDDFEITGLLLGAVDYIKKPFNPQVIKLRIQHQIKIVNLQRELKNVKPVQKSINTADEENTLIYESDEDFEKPRFRGDVLVCEDNSMHREIVCLHLSGLGLKIFIAENGEIAVGMVKKRMEAVGKPYDLIIMDVHMPVMDGYDAIDNIIELGTKTPIVVMSANIWAQTKDSYRRRYIKGYIHKPFTLQELIRLLLDFFEPIR